MRIQEFTCFGSAAGGGNPALVVEDGPSGHEERQALARERALTCVFLDAAAAPGSAATLDFVYPHMRSPLCLHATLAAARVLFDRHGTAATSTTSTRRGKTAPPVSQPAPSPPSSGTPSRCGKAVRPGTIA